MEALQDDFVIKAVNDVRTKLEKIRILLVDESLLWVQSPNSATRKNIDDQLMRIGTLLILCTIDNRLSFLSCWSNGEVTIPSLRKCFRGKHEKTAKSRDMAHKLYVVMCIYIKSIAETLIWESQADQTTPAVQPTETT